jgi:hypothetical protein
MKHFMLLACLWLCTTNTVESPTSTLELDGISYTIIPILYDQVITGSEQYDCLDCDCEECEKERKEREKKEI